MNKKIVAGLLLLLLVGCSVWWWTTTQNEEKGPVYRTEVLKRGDVSSKVTATGTLQAVTEVLVGSEVSGKLEQIYVTYNSTVKKGQILAQIDPSTYQTQVTQAQASVNNAQASLDNARGDLGNASANVKSADAAIVGAQAKVQQAEAGVLTAKASVSSAGARLEKAKSNRDNAKITYERNRDLRSRDLISQADLDTAQTSFQAAESDVYSAEADLMSAEAGLSSAKTLVVSAQSDVEAARIKKDAALDLLSGSQAKIKGFQAQVQQAQASLESAQINLQRTSITSPIDGIVMNVAVTAGQTVAAQFQAPDLFTLAQNLDQMQVETAVDEADVGRVKEGARASFTVDAFPEEKFEGTVTEVRQAPVLTSNVVTYTVIIRTTNPKLLLKPGMTATVEVYDQERKDVLLAPAEALRFKPRRANSENGSEPSSAAKDKKPESDDGDKIYTLEEGRGRPAPHSVEAGVSDGLLTEVTGADLKEGMKVVLGVQTSGESAGSSQSTGQRRSGSRRGPRMF